VYTSRVSYDRTYDGSDGRKQNKNEHITSKLMNSLLQSIETLAYLSGGFNRSSVLQQKFNNFDSVFLARNMERCETVLHKTAKLNFSLSPSLTTAIAAAVYNNNNNNNKVNLYTAPESKNSLGAAASIKQTRVKSLLKRS